MTNVSTALIIAVLTKLYQGLTTKNWHDVEMILAVIVIGFLVGYFHLMGIQPVDGVIDGLSISGVMSTGSFIGSKFSRQS